MQQLMLKSCCSRGKITCFKKLSQFEIEVIRQEFYELKTETLQNQYILDYFRRHSPDSSCKNVLFSVAGKVVCDSCWRLVYGLRYNKFKLLLSKFNDGIIAVEHGHVGFSRISTTTLRTVSWLRSFFSKVGDRMPMSDEIHLPSCLTKVDVYELARDDLCQGGLQCTSLSQFYSVWTSKFENVKIPKVAIRLISSYIVGYCFLIIGKQVH